MAGDGLSVKERLALLQSNNKNPQLSGSLVAAPNTAPKPIKPKPPPADVKPAFPALKPVSQTTGPAATGNKPTTAVKPPPATPAKPGSVGGVDLPKANGQENASPFPKLRPVAGGTSPAPWKGVTPLVPKKPAGQETETANTSPATMREKPSDSASSPRPLSIQERMAALKKKASVDGGSGPDKVGDSASPKSPVSPVGKAPMFPKPSTAPSGVFMNGPKPDGVALKPSDIAKSINLAAGRVLRTRTADAAAGEETNRHSQLFRRHSDGKKFRKIEVASVIASAPAPAKPSTLDNVDLTTFVKLYAEAKENKLNVDAAKCDQPDTVAEEEWEELYVEAESTAVPVRTRRSSLKRAQSVRISQIPEFTEEEEEKELYQDGSSVPAPVPEEFYDDCSSSQSLPSQHPSELEAPDEIYEPLDEEIEAQSPPPLPSPNIPEDKKAKKEEEKGGKKKDKGKEEVNKKEERERKKREEEIKKQRSKFGLSDTDEKVGDGLVKNNAGAGLFSGKDLGVNKGEIVSILRMDGNPAGKWLVQNDQGKIGFVTSNNIEVSTPTIRHLMTGIKTENGAEDPEETYEPLPDGEMDEIYEEL